MAGEKHETNIYAPVISDGQLRVEALHKAVEFHSGDYNANGDDVVKDAQKFFDFLVKD